MEIVIRNYFVIVFILTSLIIIGVNFKNIFVKLFNQKYRNVNQPNSQIELFYKIGLLNKILNNITIYI